MIRKFFAGLLVVVLVTIMIPVTLLFSVYSVINKDDFYRNDRVISRLHDLATDFVVETAINSKLTVLDRDVLKEVISDSIANQDLGDFLKVLMVALRDLKIGEVGIAKFNMNLEWFDHKAFAERISTELYDDLSPCDSASDDYSKIYDVKTLDCIPSGIDEDEFISKFSSVLTNTALLDIPEKIVKEFYLPEQIAGNVYEYVNSIFMLALIVTVLLVILILFSIAALVHDSFPVALRWVSFSLLLSSFVVSLFFSLFMYFPDFAITDLLVRDLLHFFSDLVLLPVLYFSLPVLILSLAVFIYSIRYERA